MGYCGARAGRPRPLRAISFRCISSCFAFRLRSSLASSSLFYETHSQYCARLYMSQITYSCDNLLYSLLVTLHIKEGLDLAQREILPVSQSDEFIESAEQFECIPQDFPLVQALADARDNLGKQV